MRTLATRAAVAPCFNCRHSTRDQRPPRPRLTRPRSPCFRRCRCRRGAATARRQRGLGRPSVGLHRPLRPLWGAVRVYRPPARARPHAPVPVACAGRVGRHRRRARRLVGGLARPRRVAPRPVWAVGSPRVPWGATGGPKAAPGGPSRARRWPTIAVVPAGAPGTLRGRRYGYLHAWTRACAIYGKFEILSRLYLGMSV